MRAFALIFMLLSVVAVGCGGGEDQVIESSVPPAAVEMKLMLENTAKSGAPIGSGGMIIQEGIDSIREQDPAKAEALQQDFNTLSSASNPATVKSSAKAMLEKL